MQRAWVFGIAAIGFLMLAGCRSKDSTSYDHALTCLEAANAMIAAAGTAKIPSAPFEQAEKVWYAKTIAEGAKTGKGDSDVRHDISDRLGRLAGRMTDSTGKPDMNKIKNDLTNQEKQLQSCST